MSRKLIEELFEGINSMIDSNRLKEAFIRLKGSVSDTGSPDYYYRLESVEETYINLLRYTAQGYRDPERARILSGIKAALLQISDEMRQDSVVKDRPFGRYQRKATANLYGRETEEFILTLENQLFSTYGNDQSGSSNSGEPNAMFSPEKIDHIFIAVLISEKLDDRLKELLEKALLGDHLNWQERSLIVSAITISLVNSFDLPKFLILADVAESKETEVARRALTGLILALIRYDRWLEHYPDLTERLRRLASEDTIIPHIELILMQFVKARDTDHITREFEEEVLPEMKKMMPRIEDKLNLDDRNQEEDMEDKNPDWKEMIGEVPGLFEKIEKFSRMQMEGSDVFMSTFRQLKRFDFFNRISSWFTPFYRDHPVIRTTGTNPDSIDVRLLESLEKAFYICNSDKYSFALNFNAIPEQQRSMIVTNFEAEFAQMREMASEEQLLDQSLVQNAIVIQYMQDLYRFYKLFPSKIEFEDAFRKPLNLPGLRFYKTLFYREEFTEKTAFYHMEKGNWAEAIPVFEFLIERKGPVGEYYEKIGFCHQKSGNLKPATEAYKKAELFDGDHLWLLKKLGWCFLKLKDYTNALYYLREVIRIQPEELTIRLQIGQCLLHLKDYESALHHYQQTRFFATDELKILRPIAYCQFVLGKITESDESYIQILQMVTQATAYDLMNAAHVKLLLGEREAAFSLYEKCFQTDGPGQSELIDAFDQDAEYLLKHGLRPEELPLIRDYIMYFGD